MDEEPIGQHSRRAARDGGERRANRSSVAGRRRADVLAARLGNALRDVRRGAKLSQSELGARTGTSQPTISALERGRGASASVDRWARLFGSFGMQLGVFVDGVPTADRPRDYEHLKRQQLIVVEAARGGWSPMVEAAVDRDRRSSRSIDVLLGRPSRREAAVVEVWDWFDDVGAALRGLDGKIATVRRQLNERGDGVDHWRVEGLWVVRGTRRNRQVATEFGELFATRFPATGRDWMIALTDRQAPMPTRAGFIWTDVHVERLVRGHRPSRADGSPRFAPGPRPAGASAPRPAGASAPRPAGASAPAKSLGLTTAPSDQPHD